MSGRILVIDDEPQITRVLRAALSAQAFDVRTANDPEEGLRIFGEWPPDLVITDLMMPGLSGVEVARAIRTTSSTPILVLSVRDHELLLHLARHPGKVITHRNLLTAVWGAQSAQQPEYLRVFVGQLRKKLESQTGKQFIQTEPWVGYRFIPEGFAGKEE
jgi:DNA-binding response OmpR family regulator